MGQIIKKYAFYLAPRPTFSSEIGRMFDFFGLFNTYNSSRTDVEADMKATYLDWKAVGQDLQSAMTK